LLRKIAASRDFLAGLQRRDVPIVFHARFNKSACLDVTSLICRAVPASLEVIGTARVLGRAHQKSYVFITVLPRCLGLGVESRIIRHIKQREPVKEIDIAIRC
jgi:hypothetical protein